MSSIFERQKPDMNLPEIIGSFMDFKRSGESQIFWVREIGVCAVKGNKIAEIFLRKIFLEKIDDCDVDVSFLIFQIFCELKEPLAETVDAMERFIKTVQRKRIAQQGIFGRSC